MKFNRIIAIFFALILVITGVTTSFAANNNEVKTSDALKIARFHVLSDIKQDSNSKWQGDKISLTNPKKVYDIDGNVTGYLINIKVDGDKAGYVHVGNSKDEFPILSYSYEDTGFDDEEIESAKGSLNAKNEKILDVGPGRFAIQFEKQDGSEVIKTKNGNEIKIEKNNELKNKKERSSDYIQKSKKFWEDASAGEIGSDHDGVTDLNPDLWEIGYDDVNYDYIPNVPDVNQWKYDGVNYTGCAPTSGSNIIAYWAYNYPQYNNLMTTQTQTIWDLRYFMGTWQTSTGTGNTLIAFMDDGMYRYASSMGFESALSLNHGSWEWWVSVAYSTFKNEINLNRPNILTFHQQSYYGDHSVTGVGYKEYVYSGSSDGHQYMIMYDNWDNGIKDVYVAYGRNYGYVVMTSFKPD